MISSIPRSAAPAASRRARANDAHATGDAFADLLQKAAGERQPAAPPTVDRRPPDQTATGEPATHESITNERPADPGATKAADERASTADGAPHGEHDANAAATTAGAASVVAVSSVVDGPSTGPTPVDVSTTAAASVAGEPVTAVNRDTAVAKAPDAPADPALSPGAAEGKTVVAKDAVKSTDHDKSEPHGGSGPQHAATPVAVAITDNVANRVGERVQIALPSAEPAATAVHADHQAVARAADVMTTGQHAGPTTTNRLSLEMDGKSRVVVRMDDAGRLVHVDVLADPAGRLGGAWHSDISESLHNHGLELDQRGADTTGEEHRRKDQTDDRFATDGGSPRKPVHSRTARPGSLWL